ncbi:MAG: ABC transporter ATP-binding protein [Clostridium sp.]
MKKLAEIKDLTIGFPDGKTVKHVVDGISFPIYEGEILGVVGESGSGKSMTALAVMGLLPEDAKVLSGTIDLRGTELLSMKKDEIRKIQGNEMAMVFQEPMTSLNPVMIIEKQVGESLELHTDLCSKAIHERVVQALTSVGLAGAEELCHKYPHELSGGMRQRVMIAQAMISSPALLIADEPTTALDVIVQAQILRLLKKVHKEQNTSILFISHDLNVVREVCDRVLVIYKGKIVEQGNTGDVLKNPTHEYTKQLIASIPEATRDEENGKEILRLNHLNVFYDIRSGAFWKPKIKKHVIQDVSLTAYDGEILGIVGESGCGKSTLCKAILGLNKNYTGEIHMEPNIRPQMVFQDPFSSLNPAKKIGWILEEPLKLQGISDRIKRKQMVSDMLVSVGLDASFANRRARELSGGQRQRISIGAALLMDSRLIIADEPVSALDVTVQSQILNLLLRMHREKHMTILFITHDLNIVHRICSWVAVIYLGEIVEMGSVDEVYCTPMHPYTTLLLESIVDGNPNTEEKAVADIGETASRALPGCPFYPRCPKHREECRQSRPERRMIEGTHSVKCFLYD